ncbi:MAG TPA: F0F1 ATP synthase subunit gamma [Acidimicrobiales bacterium]|nr:F0F1 ATP synthase subunit gamma [Acidimicrobiales bacterium]
MAGGQERLLRRRIRSVQSTRKITRAMELIAASRIVRAQQAIKAARPYVDQMREVVRNLADTPEAANHPIFRRPDSMRRAALIVITADRGLAGAYNSSVLRASERTLARHRQEGHDVMLVTVGRKADSHFRFRNRPPATAVTGISDRPGFADARRVVGAVMEAYAEGDLDQVQLIYTRFRSMGVQEVTLRQLVPLEDVESDEEVGHHVDYEYEPDPREILDRLLPRWLEAEVFAALLESAASEHAARQRAMKAATDNADELTKVLTRRMNRARQDTITTEIMEIVGGAEALGAGASDGAGAYHGVYVPQEST